MWEIGSLAVVVDDASVVVAFWHRAREWVLLPITRQHATPHEPCLAGRACLGRAWALWLVSIVSRPRRCGVSCAESGGAAVAVVAQHSWPWLGQGQPSTQLVLLAPWWARW